MTPAKTTERRNERVTIIDCSGDSRILYFWVNESRPAPGVPCPSSAPIRPPGGRDKVGASNINHLNQIERENLFDQFGESPMIELV